MYQTIVVGTDGSETARRAVGRAAALAALTGAELHIAMAAARLPVVASPDMMVGLGDFVETSEQATIAALEEAAGDAAAAGVTSTTHPLRGHAADALLALCEEQHADLLVVGNRGMQGVQRFLGSVASRCAHHAPTSVLIVATDQ